MDNALFDKLGSAGLLIGMIIGVQRGALAGWDAYSRTNITTTSHRGPKPDAHAQPLSA